MRLSKNFLILWCLRLLLLSAVFIPLSLSVPQPLSTLFILGSLELAGIALVFLRYRSFQLNLCDTAVHITCGLLIRKTTIVRIQGMCSVKTFSTPLCTRLGLENLVLYCEGVRFFLPPLDKEHTSLLQKQISKKERSPL